MGFYLVYLVVVGREQWVRSRIDDQHPSGSFLDPPHWPPTSLLPHLHDTATDSLGKILLGFITPKWRIWQVLYLAILRSRWSPLWWISELIKKLWDVVWDLWQSRNHYIHTSGSVKNTSMLTTMDGRIRYHYLRRWMGLSIHHQFLFQPSLDRLLSCRLLLRVSCFLIIINARRAVTRQHHSLPTPYEALLVRLLHPGALSSLQNLDSAPPLQTQLYFLYARSPVLTYDNDDSE